MRTGFAGSALFLFFSVPGLSSHTDDFQSTDEACCLHHFLFGAPELVQRNFLATGWLKVTSNKKVKNKQTKTTKPAKRKENNNPTTTTKRKKHLISATDLTLQCQTETTYILSVCICIRRYLGLDYDHVKQFYFTFQSALHWYMVCLSW